MISGQITVTTAKTAVAGPDVIVPAMVILKYIGPTGYGYVNEGVSGDLSGKSYVFDIGEKILTDISNLKSLWFDASVSGGKFCWILC